MMHQWQPVLDEPDTEICSRCGEQLTKKNAKAECVAEGM